MELVHRPVSRRWVVAPPPDSTLVDGLVTSTGLSRQIIQILVSRGLETTEKIESFLDPNLKDLKDPFSMLGMERLVERVSTALMQNEKIIIYGDYDVDGITATTLLFLVLRRLGAQVDYFLPNRLVEGYGLSEDGINAAIKKGVSLIITVDTGITAVDEVAYANSKGVDILITDHHEPAERTPEAFAIVNPKQVGCSYGGELSGVGVAFKVAQALYNRFGQDEAELSEHLDLVALGTSADIVPLVGENRILTRFGMKQIAMTAKPGLKWLIDVSGIIGKSIGTGQIVFVLAPRINALGRLGSAEQAVRLLATHDDSEAREIAKALDNQNNRRKEIDEYTLNQAMAQLAEIVNLEEDRAIVLAADGWHQGVIGIVASRIVEKYHLPTVMIAVENGEGKGSARSIPGFHLCEALKECEHLLVRYGGHKYAAGLSIKSEHIDEFRKKFLEVSRSVLSAEDIVPKLNIDLDIELATVNEEFMDSMERFSPFGPHNMRPVFVSRGCEVIGNPFVVGRNHLKMRVMQGGKRLDVIGFGLGERVRELSDNCMVDIVYTLEYNTFNGRTTIQIRLKDVRLAAGEDYMSRG